MEKKELIAAIKNSGGAEQPDEEVESLLSKLNYLEKTGRYGRLIAGIKKANDRNNFLALVFETTFSYHFESAGLNLEYEVKQNNQENTTIDFLRRTESGTSIYMEARLLQQDKATQDSVKEQLENTGFYQVLKDGNADHDEIVRLQSVIVSKVEKADGTPIKFLAKSDNIVNIVVVEVSDLILGAIDIYDCLLATHGDSYVDEIYRRGIFGLFQSPSTEYPSEIQKVAESFEHIRHTLSGVLFTFKENNSGVLDYGLEHCMIWNPNLVDQSLAEEVCSEINQALPIKKTN